jgi:hypothetical protein
LILAPVYPILIANGAASKPTNDSLEETCLG